MPEYQIIEISNLNIPLLQKMADESLQDGITFIQKAIVEWKEGVNTFSKPGEKLWGVVIDNEIIGLGGINKDPYIEDQTIGRVRHVYVMKGFRRLGLSKIMMNLVIEQATKYFKTLRLYTDNPIASALYESDGFKKTEGYKVTHVKEI